MLWSLMQAALPRLVAARRDGSEFSKPRLIFDLDETIVHTVLRQDLCADAIARLVNPESPGELLPTSEDNKSSDCGSLIYAEESRPQMPKLGPTAPKFCVDDDDDDDIEDDGSGTPMIYLPRPEAMPQNSTPTAGRGGYIMKCLVDRRAGRGAFIADDTIGTEYAVMYVRPGILEALHRLAERYTLCLCTFGALNYVADVLKAIDNNGELFGDRVLVRGNFLGNVKCVPREWGNLRDVVVVDDRASVWEAGATVIQVDSFAQSYVPARGSRERISMDKYTHELATNLENCALSYRGEQEFQKRQSAKPNSAAWQRERYIGFSEHVAMFWPVMSQIKVATSGGGDISSNAESACPQKTEADDRGSTFFSTPSAEELVKLLPPPPPRHRQHLTVDSPFEMELPELSDDECEAAEREERKLNLSTEEVAWDGGEDDSTEEDMVTVILECSRAAAETIAEREAATCVGEHGSFLAPSIRHEFGTLVCAEASS